METLANVGNQNLRPAKRSIINKVRTRGLFIDADPKVPKGLVTITHKQAAEILGVAKRTLQRYAQKGYLTRYYGCLYDQSEVKSFIKPNYTRTGGLK